MPADPARELREDFGLPPSRQLLSRINLAKAPDSDTERMLGASMSGTLSYRVGVGNVKSIELVAPMVARIETKKGDRVLVAITMGIEL